MYQPRDIAWIKESLIAHFSGQQAVPAPPSPSPQYHRPQQYGGQRRRR